MPNEFTKTKKLEKITLYERDMSIFGSSVPLRSIQERYMAHKPEEDQDLHAEQDKDLAGDSNKEHNRSLKNRLFIGRWTDLEHTKFLEGKFIPLILVSILAVFLFGKNQKKVQEFVGTRSVVQIRSHAQKYFLNMEKIEGKIEPSVHQPMIGKYGFTKRSFDFLLQKICDDEISQEHTS